MGPITILDKSAFQALSERELVFLEKHMMMNIPPVLVFEVLGDLSKEAAKGKAPPEKVRELAGKFGGSGSIVNDTYTQLVMHSLLGAEIPMTGQIVPDNYFISSSGGMMIDLSPLNEAILRWSMGQFNESEEELSKRWRAVTHSPSLSGLQEEFNRRHIILPTPAGEGDVQAVADSLIREPRLQEMWVRWIAEQTIPRQQIRQQVMRRWSTGRWATLERFAPYAHFCMRAFLAHAIAVRHRFLKWKPTNLVDLQYLFYLPFCMAFISDDRVHRLLAPGLLRDDQDFIQGTVLKADLRRIADRWEQLSWDQRAREAYALASYPPPAANSVVYDLWRKRMRPWNGPQNLVSGLDDEERAQALAEAHAMFDAMEATKPFDEE
jgi:hypothetical protein